MNFTRSTVLAMTISVASVLSGCGEPPAIRGYQVDDRALEQIKPGTSAESVVLVLGTPSMVSTVGGKGYYYVSQSVSQRYQFMAPTITDQRVIAVFIDGKNKVERVGNYGMEDGKVFDFVSRQTPTGGDELSLIRQLLKASNLSSPNSPTGQPGQ